MSRLPRITYNDGTARTLNFTDGALNFLPEDADVVHNNVSSSGYRERVLECSPILIAFIVPKMFVGGDFDAWWNFYKWARPGNAFTFIPNLSALVSGVPWGFSCVLEDTGFKPKKIAPTFYSLDCKFRVVPDGSVASSGQILAAFWGFAP